LSSEQIITLQPSRDDVAALLKPAFSRDVLMYKDWQIFRIGTVRYAKACDTCADMNQL